MANFNCPRCKNRIEVPDELGTEAQESIASLRRGGEKLEAIEATRGRSQLAPSSAAALVNHLSTAQGGCHRCGEILTDGGPVYCSTCCAFNVNW